MESLRDHKSFTITLDKYHTDRLRRITKFYNISDVAFVRTALDAFGSTDEEFEKSLDYPPFSIRRIPLTRGQKQYLRKRGLR